MNVFILLNSPEAVYHFAEVAIATQGSWVATTTATILNSSKKFDPKNPARPAAIQLLVFQYESGIRVTHVNPFKPDSDITQAYLLSLPDYAALYALINDNIKE